MDKKTLKLIRGLLVFLLAIAALIFFVIVATDSNDTIEEQKILSGDIDNYFTVAYIAFFIAIISALLTWLYELITHPKKAIQFLIGILLFAAVVVIAYFMSNNHPQTYGKIKISGTTSAWVDTGLYTFYILGAIALVTMLLSPVLSMVGFGKSGNNIEEEIEEVETDE